VHVICGGGSGEKIISKLIAMNFSVSCGVVNAGDSDWRFCRANSVEMIEEEPYRPICEQNYARNIESIKNSRAVVVCEFPLGSGNLANLKFIDEIAGMNDIKVFCAEGGGPGGDACGGLDFTGGAADGCIKKIRARASLFGSAEDLEKLIDTL
jgi:iron complex transport system ATP-binding protein